MAFFSGSNGLFKFTGRVLDVVVLSTLWLVCSLPIVTIGPATAALYYSCVKCLRWKEPSPYRNFLSAFKDNLKSGTLATIFTLLLAFLLYCGDIFFLMASGTGETFWAMTQGAYRVLLLLPLGLLTVMFPLLSRFTFTASALWSTSLGVTIRHMPRVVLAGIVHGAALLAIAVGWFYGLMLIVPALDMLVISFLLEPVFRKYTPAEAEDEEVEASWYLRSNK